MAKEKQSITFRRVLIEASTLSVYYKCELVALLCAQIPMDIVDMKDVIDIIKENRDRYMKNIDTEVV